MTSAETHIRKGQWKELKGLVQKKWGQLTDDDLEKTKGNYKMLVGLVQEKYGLAKKEAEDRLTALVDRFSDPPTIDELGIYQNQTRKLSDETNEKIENLKKKVKNEIF